MNTVYLGFDFILGQ